MHMWPSQLANTSCVNSTYATGFSSPSTFLFLEVIPIHALRELSSSRFSLSFSCTMNAATLRQGGRCGAGGS